MKAETETLLDKVDRKIMLRNAHRLLRNKYRRMPLWSFISDITGHGSGYSCRIAKECGWEPCQYGHLPLD